ncbi:MAG: hydroxyacid dehydrogenase [Candidatus Parvarchaeota archaeon]|nr:hydroxyacid dehydrogenase [Candidatus Parvarchaeota archaeon]
MKILMFDVSDLENERIRKFADENKELDIKVYRTDVTAVKDEDCDADVISIFINSAIKRENLERFTRLKFILTRSTGFDHIDINECKNRGIKVCNVPDYGDATVAEFVFFLALCLMRGTRLDRTGEIKTTPGRELNGKTIGIIGAGRIGTRVAEIAKAFRMRILYDSHRNNQIIDGMGGLKVGLDELLSSSDIVSLHVPLTDETYHLINKDNIKRFKPGSFIINTSRGATIDTEALIEGLDSGTIAGAALDVIEGEEFSGREMEIIRKKENYDMLRIALEGNILRRYENVILTPHIAYNTHEALGRIIDETLENLSSIASGKEPRNQLD